MKNKEIQQKSHEMVLGKRNYILLIIGSVLIIIGYILMSGGRNTPSAYNPEIFDKLRISVAPILCVAGYLLNAIGIVAYTPTRH